MDSSRKPGWLLRLVGLSALSLATCSHIAYRVSDGFETTDGIITASFINQISGQNQPKRCETSGQTSLEFHGPAYTRVFYKYEVNGKTYRRETQMELVSQSDSERFVSEFGAGRRLTVFYDPADPYQSQIFREFPPNESFLIGLGLSTFLLASFCGRFEWLSRLFDISVTEEVFEPPTVGEPEHPIVVLSR
jgi:hypothetical protein